jgi:hypothetical protein
LWILASVPHRIVGTWVYDLPFGKGKPYLTNGVLAALAGGWRIGGAVNYMTGAPMQIFAQGSGSFNSRPDRCQGKVEMSPSWQSRNVPFSLAFTKVHANLPTPVKRRRALVATNPIEE